MSFYEWKVCNSSEIDDVKFPYIEKSISLENYYDQDYRIWKTENAITLYQPSKRSFVLFYEYVDTGYIQFGENDFLRMVRLEDGTIDIYHGQMG